MNSSVAQSGPTAYHPRSGPRAARDWLRCALCLPAVGSDLREERVDVIDHESEMSEAWVERLDRRARPIQALILQQFDRLIR